MQRFQAFPSVWTPVAHAAELVASRPLPLKVAGEPVVLFRGDRGAVGALVDRCPHRGVKLSGGRLRDGCLECPFHGWRFAADGSNRHVPWNPEAKLERLGAQPLPARELGGLLWIYTRVGVEAPAEPELPEELLRAGVRKVGQSFTWNAHWTRAVENMLDDTHLPFVHSRTIGRGLALRERSRLDHHVERHGWGFSWRTSIDGVMQGQSAEFRWPNTMLLRVPVPGRLLGIHFSVVPVDAQRVRLIQLSVRDFLRVPLLDFVFHRINRGVLVEDRSVVESSPGEVPLPTEERSVRTDAPALAFRKRYLRELAPRRELPIAPLSA